MSFSLYGIPKILQSTGRFDFYSTALTKANSIIRPNKKRSPDGERFALRFYCYPCITGRNLYPYIRLGPRCGSESVNLMAYVSGGRGSWLEKAKGRKCLKGLNPFGRGNVPARPPVRNVGKPFDCKTLLPF
jgi:hypothetical protein